MKRKYLFRLSCLLLITGLAPAARADEPLPNPVHTWNELALHTVRTGRLSDAQAARLYALINVAMYDACLRSPQGVPVALTRGEVSLLAAFLSAPQRVLSRDELLDLSRMHDNEVFDRSLESQPRCADPALAPKDRSQPGRTGAYQDRTWRGVHVRREGGRLVRSMGVKTSAPSSASGRLCACEQSRDRQQPGQQDGMAARGLRRILSPILITVLIASCDGDVPTGTPATLRFGYDYWPGYYPALIAAEKGYFAEEGLTVKATKRDDTDALIADFGAGEYDAIGASLGDIVDLILVHPDVRIILVTDISEGGDAVLARPGIEEVEDLRGRAFGVNLGSFAELFVLTVLKSHGLSSADIHLVDTDAAELPAKLKSGEVDAGHTWEPFVTRAQDQGARVLFTSAATPGLIQDVVAVRGEVLRERAKALNAFVKGWFKAVDFWKAHPDQGDTLAARVLDVAPNTISLEGIRLTTL